MDISLKSYKAKLNEIINENQVISQKKNHLLDLKEIESSSLEVITHEK